MGVFTFSRFGRNTYNARVKIILALIFLIFGIQTQKVYICKSGSGYAYHNKQCWGLGNYARKYDTGGPEIRARSHVAIILNSLGEFESRIQGPLL
ncbi:hypothetical protein D3H65_00540 [Paraflavitalea soli]|uniref:Uncharacterized protein n=1 Tax=Paraflavitalea soli TaxID=2315862 RepID=A0A3B7MGV8_9BACT|nr:hypothetical protein D3H65_00540 [Paraflavitalea soli]